MIAKEKRHLDVSALLSGEVDTVPLAAPVETVIVHTPAGQQASGSSSDSGIGRSSGSHRKCDHMRGIVYSYLDHSEPGDSFRLTAELKKATRSYVAELTSAAIREVFSSLWESLASIDSATQVLENATISRGKPHDKQVEGAVSNDDDADDDDDC